MKVGEIPRGFRTAGVAACGVAVAALLAMVVGTPFARAADPNTYSGRAYAVGVKGLKVAGVAVPDQFIADSGALPASGGSQSAGVGTVTAPPVGSVNVLEETATGGSGKANATSRIAGAHLLPQTGGGNLVDVVTATAMTGVDTKGQTVLSSQVVGLQINGTVVTVPTGTNVVVTVPGPSAGSVTATVIFNQQKYDPITNTAVANAVVIDFPATGTLAAAAVGTITISHAASGLAVPPFAITKTANGGPTATVTAGSNVTYAITVVNQVQNACQLQSITDLLPPQGGEGGTPFTYVSGGPADATVTQAAVNGQNQVTWTYASGPTLAPGASYTLTFIAKVPSDEVAGTYTNIASYVSNCGNGTTGNTATVTVGPGTPPANAGPVPPAATPFSSALGHHVPTAPLALAGLGLALIGLAIVIRRRSVRVDS